MSMATQPVEDIDSVLGRFQAWTGARAARGAKAGVRELSDEEALASGRYRWKPQRANAAKSAAAPVKSAAISDEGFDTRARERGKAPEPKSRTAKQRDQTSVPEQAQRKPPARKQEKTKPAFREVLAKAVAPAEVIVKPQPVELSRQVAISIRLAPSERALIKTRASEAGVTASAYIRQCALEIEQLRDQVRRAVSAMERGELAAPVLDPVLQPAPAKGFFAWMARKLFLRKTPALALRA